MCVYLPCAGFAVWCTLGEMECKPQVFLLYCYSVIITKPGDGLSYSEAAVHPYVSVCECMGQ